MTDHDDRQAVIDAAIEHLLTADPVILASADQPGRALRSMTTPAQHTPAPPILVSPVRESACARRTPAVMVREGAPADRREEQIPMTEMPALLKMKPRPHQVLAANAATAGLTLGPGQVMPPQGLRIQLNSATGSGKTLMGVIVAHQQDLPRILVLAPNLDLLAQLAAGWRAAGHDHPVVGLSSLRSTEDLPCTTDPDELVALTAHLPRVTVFATYASVAWVLCSARTRPAFRRWSLIVEDEAHRLSGAAGKPWAAVLDNNRIPADRRLVSASKEHGRSAELWAGLIR